MRKLLLVLVGLTTLCAVEARTLDKPAARWSGVLSLPQSAAERDLGAVYITLENAPQTNLIGQRLLVNYDVDDVVVGPWFAQTRIDVEFSDVAHEKRKEGFVLAEPIDGWRQVSVLQSLAAARPNGIMRVELVDPRLEIDAAGKPHLVVTSEPIQLLGNVQIFVQFTSSSTSNPYRYQVRHYNPATGNFDGAEETIEVIADIDNLREVPSEQIGLQGIERHAINRKGFRLFGTRTPDGVFLAEGMEPYSLVAVRDGSDIRITGRGDVQFYVAHQQSNIDASYKTHVRHLILDSNADQPLHAKVGDRFLISHLFGSFNDHGRSLGAFRGHYSYGIATVRAHPFTGQPFYELVYKQTYAHNRSGVISGSIHYHDYQGHFGRGRAFYRLQNDVLIDLGDVDYDFAVTGASGEAIQVNGVEHIARALDRMNHLYRTGFTGGVSIVDPAVSCVQDSNQALVNAISELDGYYRSLPRAEREAVGERLRRLVRLGAVHPRQPRAAGLLQPRGWRDSGGGAH